ncbi:MAG: hypothetical protein GWM98_05195 [Nitrospinaceae bacterium]|nr:hypothetical protein [Nitrospinaceae bacterium]NIR53959.1 hypothetical protein [Nitrospinaceae bacterium]NIS84377.1 hypothetical protein [Nitrospinaceae bacterium]NIT81179.1 hypothetical protein [Nitrospinaceae bacterium]NIU43462.1 hypothetical protein [Nitrospinaceae bacterium]
MNRLWILSAGLLLLSGWLTSAWAHGPQGFRSSQRGFHAGKTYQRPRPFQLRRAPRAIHQGRSRSIRKPRPGYYGPGNNGLPARYRAPSGYYGPGDNGLPRIQSGVLLSKPGPLQTRSFTRPLGKRSSSSYGPIYPKSVPPGNQFSNPKLPWFYYGHGDAQNFRGGFR